MKEMKRRTLILLAMFLVLFPYRIRAAEVQTTNEEYFENWYNELDFSDLDKMLETELSTDERKPIRFSSIVDELLTDGWNGFDSAIVLTWVKDALVYELNLNRRILVEVVVLVVAFSAIRNFSGAFKQAYITEISFFFVYSMLALLLLQSFQNYGMIVEKVMNQSVDFMKALIPTFCISMVFSASAGTSASFYQLAFLVIYLIQWLFLKVLMPLIKGYILLVLFNHFFEDEKFENLTELLKGIINWGLKCAVMVVIGMNVVQGLIAPAKDCLMTGTVQKAATMIPGVGTVMNGVGELLLGSGILVKNCVGVAALVVLLMLGVLPMLKIVCLALLYKLAAVALEPLADKRIVGCLRGMAEGGILYLRLVLYCLSLFLVTIALATASTGIHI